jgi:hypothetical protein
MEYIRNCPVCGVELKTKNKYYYQKSVKQNTKCLSCSLKGRTFTNEHKCNLSKNHADFNGDKNPFKGKSHSDETRKYLSKIQTERMSDPINVKILSDAMVEYHKYNDNSFKGKHHTNETKSYISNIAKIRWTDSEYRNTIENSVKLWYLENDSPFKGKSHSDETRKYLSKLKTDLWSNTTHPWVGRTHSSESIAKMRESAIERVKRNGMPHSYNPNSIPIIEQYGVDNGYKFKHAENGGEYQIPGTTFFVDGYDETNNIVIEYDEPHHFRNGELHPKDIWRMNLIISKINCIFVRIDYKGNINIYEN